LHKLKEPERFGSWAFKIIPRKALGRLNKHKKGQHQLQEYGILVDTAIIDTSTDDRVLLV
jgi:hypothetical protein